MNDKKKKYIHRNKNTHKKKNHGSGSQINKIVNFLHIKLSLTQVLIRINFNNF